MWLEEYAMEQWKETAIETGEPVKFDLVDKLYKLYPECKCTYELFLAIQSDHTKIVNLEKLLKN